MLSRRTLNRTLLRRQHLLARVDGDPLAMAEHLLGLQAQEPLPPYLSLAARLESLRPARPVPRAGDAGGGPGAADARHHPPGHAADALGAAAARAADARPGRPAPAPRRGRRPDVAAGRPARRGGRRRARPTGRSGSRSSGSGSRSGSPDVPPAARWPTRLRELTAAGAGAAARAVGRGGGVVYEHLDTWLGGELHAVRRPAEVVAPLPARVRARRSPPTSPPGRG